MTRPLFIALVLLLFATAPAPAATDTDGDGIEDSQDNCLETPNASQLDSDGDGCGNACDADYDQTGSVDGSDFMILRSMMGRTSGDADFDGSVDLTGDNVVGGTDFIIFRAQMNGTPGPSLVATRDVSACP